MKKLIAAREFLQITGCEHDLLASNDGLKLLNQTRPTRLSQALHNFQLQGSAKELGLTRQRKIDRAHDCCMLRKYFDELFLFKFHQGISDRCRAKAKLLGQGSAGQHCPRTQFERNDALAQKLEDL